MYKRNENTLASLRPSDLATYLMNKRADDDLDDEGEENKLEKDISIKCCVLGCPYSLYAAHCELRKRSQLETAVDYDY